MKRNIFIYWTGREYSLISLLQKLIKLHSKNGIGYTLHIINEKKIKEYIENIPDNFYNLLPAHQADFVRVNVICEYGGIWLDSDTLVLDSLDSLFDIIEKHDGFLIKDKDNNIINGVFGSKKSTKLMIEWKDKIDDILNKKGSKISWTEIGSLLLGIIYKNNSNLFNDYLFFEGKDNFYPVHWDICIEEYINKPYENYKNLKRSFQLLIILVNSVYKKLDSLTEDKILNLKTPLNYFINKSYDNYFFRNNPENYPSFGSQP